MAIAGVSLNTSVTSFQSRQEAQQANQNTRGGTNVAGQTLGSTNGGVTIVSNGGTEVTATSSVPIQPPRQGNPTTSLQTSRRSPAENEATANQFRLQRESTQGNPAIEEFVSVATFEQRDSLASQTGIDIFV